ncbi:MAG: shikimate dehydrogenase [Gammaproteobacteria bacterium]|nr:shikimate dehydrogenase [Gammaproteobacteria bacterium]
MHKILLGVVGKNISYSKSPFIHQAFAKAKHIRLSYTIEDVGEGIFAEKIAALRTAGFLGCNITLPYKEEAFALADHRSPRAIQAGAANTFLFKEGKIFADNTDGIALVRDLTHNIGFSVAGKRILICGAGGAVRGILGPLLDQHPLSIVLANRSLEKANALTHLFQSTLLKTSTYEALSGNLFDLIIDGTSLQTDILPFPHLGSETFFYDLKYNTPSATLHWAKMQGMQTHDGLGMLIEQAAESFKIWTHRKVNTTPIGAQLK